MHYLFYMTEKWQEVDQDDHLLGPISPAEALRSSDAIHRRVAVLLYDEDGMGLFWQAAEGHWDLPSVAVLDGETSRQAAERLLAELGLQSSLREAGGLLLLQNEGSSQTHLFLGPWQGHEPRMPPGTQAWKFWSKPPGSGAYRECSSALLRALRKGPLQSVRMRKDLR